MESLVEVDIRVVARGCGILLNASRDGSLLLWHDVFVTLTILRLGATDAGDIEEVVVALVEDKYRGTKAYHEVREKMLQAARRGHLIYYADIASIMALPSSGHHMSKEVGHMSGEI